MTPHTRYSLPLVIACWLLTSATQTAAAVLPASDEAPTCNPLRPWAVQHFAGTQPTLDDLAPYDRAHRLAIVDAVTPEARAALWQEQIARFSRRTDLSAEQRALTSEAAAVLTPAVYRGAPAALQAVEPVRIRADRLFTSAVHRRAWYQLGTVSADGEISTETVTTRAGLVQCNCNGMWDCFGAPCASTGCTPLQRCGFGGSQTCTGVCQ